MLVRGRGTMQTGKSRGGNHNDLSGRCGRRVLPPLMVRLEEIVREADT
jgi:hypothetical protein